MNVLRSARNSLRHRCFSRDTFEEDRPPTARERELEQQVKALRDEIERRDSSEQAGFSTISESTGPTFIQFSRLVGT